MPRMTKLLLQLQAAAADRRHCLGLSLGFGPGRGRRHPQTPRHAPAAGRFSPACLALCLLAVAAAATTLAVALHRQSPDPAAVAGPAASPR